MDLLPAIDIHAGRCVRLLRGDFDQETVYADDPVDVARGFGRSGARWIHVVDLDATRQGEPVHLDLVGRVCRSVASAVQVGGGVRSAAAAEALLEAGTRRVVLGTAAVEVPELVDELARCHPGRIAVGLDVRDGAVAVRGWEEDSGTPAGALLERFARSGVAAVVCTEIGRDGTMEGPDLAGLARLLAASPIPVIASGGVGSLLDLRRLALLRAGGRDLAGVVVGRALYEGRFAADEALRLLLGMA